MGTSKNGPYRVKLTDVKQNSVLQSTPRKFRLRLALMSRITFAFSPFLHWSVSGAGLIVHPHIFNRGLRAWAGPPRQVSRTMGHQMRGMGSTWLFRLLLIACAGHLCALSPVPTSCPTSGGCVIVVPGHVDGLNQGVDIGL